MMKPFLLGDPRLGRSIQKSIPKTNGKQFFFENKGSQKSRKDKQKEGSSNVTGKKA
jgi:hypothetical protein